MKETQQKKRFPVRTGGTAATEARDTVTLRVGGGGKKQRTSKRKKGVSSEDEAKDIKKSSMKKKKVQGRGRQEGRREKRASSLSPEFKKKFAPSGLPDEADGESNCT